MSASWLLLLPIRADRTHCKFLQQVLKYEWGFDSLPVNMMPMSQLEAIIGAILAREKAKNPDNIKIVSHFRELNVIDVVKTPVKENLLV